MSLFKSSKSKKVNFKVVGGKIFEDTRESYRAIVLKVKRMVSIRPIGGKNFKGEAKISKSEITKKDLALKIAYTVLNIVIVAASISIIYSLAQIIFGFEGITFFMNTPFDIIQPLN